MQTFSKADKNTISCAFILKNVLTLHQEISEKNKFPLKFRKIRVFRGRNGFDSEDNGSVSMSSYVN